MRNLIIILCMACAPIVSSLPQYSVDAQIISSQPQYVQPPAQVFTDSPDANIIAFSPERTRARLSGAGSTRGQSRYPAATQPLPVGPATPEQYFVPQAAQVPQTMPQHAVQQQYVGPQVHQSQPQPQVQPQPQIRSRQQYTTPPAEEKANPHTHTPTPPIEIIKLDKSQSLDGSYKQSWESANNIMVEETGYWKDRGSNNDEKSLVQQGSYSYMAPDGTLISTSYTADDEGFKVEGSHLPTPPPIPEEIQKGLNQIYEGIRLQQELDAKDLKEGKIRPKQYDDLTGLPIDEGSQNYPQNPPQKTGSHQRQQHYQPPQYQPPQYQSPQYQQTENQSQLYQRQQYRPTK